MVNRLSELADFLESDSLPTWLKHDLEAKREEISAAMEHGRPITFEGPNGETVTLTSKESAVQNHA